MSDSPALQGFLDKWRARWPEWQMAELFLAKAQRDIAIAWFALLDEWMEAAVGSQDTAPGLAKLAWWQEELNGWAKGAYRHPLGVALQAQTAEWNVLAQSLSVLRHRDLLLGEPTSALAALTPFAEAVCRMETVLFGSAAAVDAVSLQCMLSQASTQTSSTRLAFSNAVSSAGVAMENERGAAPRRILATLIDARMREEVKPGQWRPLSAWRALWLAWGAARFKARPKH